MFRVWFLVQSSYIIQKWQYIVILPQYCLIALIFTSKKWDRFLHKLKLIQKKLRNRINPHTLNSFREQYFVFYQLQTYASRKINIDKLLQYVQLILRFEATVSLIKITNVPKSKKTDREKIYLSYCNLDRAYTKTHIKFYSSFRTSPKSPWPNIHQLFYWLNSL